VVSAGELLYGAHRSTQRQATLANLRKRLKFYTIVGVDLRTAEIYGANKAELRSQPIDDADLWIASTALRYGVPVVTHNLRHFERVPGLSCISRSLD
jgi:tRNA(fMet)-specific endonuclease VapC